MAPSIGGRALKGSRISRFLASRRARGWALVLLAATAFGTAAAMQMHWGRRDRLLTVTIAASRDDWPRRDGLASLTKLAAAQGLVVASQETLGSAEALEGVEAGIMDLAIIPGGIDFTRYKNIREVTSLHIQPLHLLVRHELAADVATHLGALKGKSVDLGGGSDSATYWLARDVLKFAGLRLDAGDYVAVEHREESNGVRPRARPDAVFVATTLPSPLVTRLVKQGQYRLVPLPFHDAFALQAMSETPQTGEQLTPTNERTLVIRKEHIPDAVIPAFTYAADPAEPPEPLHTLGMTMLLIANKNVDPIIVERVLEVLFHTRYARLIRPPLDVRRLEEPPEIPWHAGAIAYLEHGKPILTGQLLSVLGQWVTVLGPLVGGLLFVRQWFKQRFRFASEKSFETYIAKVSRLERTAMDLWDSGPVQISELERLERELGRLKVEALARFARGEMEGVNMMTNFLTHVSDARDHLGRLAARRQRAVSLEQTVAQAPEPPMDSADDSHSLDGDRHAGKSG